ncbi:uncharacterized protein SCHCODRAFT_02621786 [Schizophyllum commune H4-8]|uniref:STEEP1 domain-containing protein n=1 Tax=Schizophyllum commune (strain H4-8 / FGSC 9210) TaxID=578458 RepID=D8PPI1_SCHCM|nr:uncharacterized protein SCHCODRAFT_02621786 [Schizophyllum commune H4-8]KAI5893430.1 hypothetical protein SCHCODRAFT_02621786 [Schizophyllum commune H4-8]
MPKVISRSTVASSQDARPTESSTTALRVYYCICGEFILVIDKVLSALPRRRTDNAIIVRAQDSEAGKAHVFKLNAVPGDSLIIERQGGGHERQFRQNCPRCTLPVAYQPTPGLVKSSEFFYILPGALTQTQGQVPSDAFDGEVLTQ